MNDATREMIEKAKAARLQKDIDNAAKRNARAEHKRKRLEANEASFNDLKRSIVEDTIAASKTAIHRSTKLTHEQLTQVGSSIPGSSLVRDFCVECGEAMRVVDAGKPNICLECRPTGCPGDRSGTATRSDIEYHGGRFNSAEW